VFADETTRGLFTTFVLLSVFLLAGALEVMAGHLSVGSPVAFNALVLPAAGPSLGLLGLWERWQSMGVILTRMRDIVDRDPEQPGSDTELTPVGSLEGRVTLSDVGFRYPASPEVVVLRGPGGVCQPRPGVAGDATFSLGLARPRICGTVR
jgi:ABC-type bacteriocin/lantibiotic exporter with double-glycine peptidase domain